jgi:hypothetical protein
MPAENKPQAKVSKQHAIRSGAMPAVSAHERQAYCIQCADFA